MSEALDQKIRQLQGPILVLGASGFVGANLFRSILSVRPDVFGTSSRSAAWRLEGLPEKNLQSADLLVERNLVNLIDRLRPRTVLDCVAYGAYSFEKESGLIFRTNISYVVRLTEELARVGVARYIHAGSSSEYGETGAGPGEESSLKPNSAYAASKAAASGYLYYLGKKNGFPCANLRLYSVYGPWEDSSRLIPALVVRGLAGSYPPLVDPKVSRDFIYADDASEAFIDAALGLKPEQYGESFNIGSGQKTTMEQLAGLAREIFSLKEAPAFGGMERRTWDLNDWYADPSKATRAFGWSARTGLKEGLQSTVTWYKGLRDPERYQRVSKRFGPDPLYSLSVVVACQEGPEALEGLYKRLKAVLEKLNIQHEIILVDDSGREGLEEAIRDLSARDRDVVGLSHSRAFGSQAAFRSGMEASSKNACVLMLGSLQDPPEVIEQFVEKWKEGYEVVYGRPGKESDPFLVRLAYRLFYRVFDRFSYISLPRDAGDFGLMNKRVVQSLLKFRERDFFVRGIRAFAGFKQAGVDYARPRSKEGGVISRVFGNLGRAKRGILAFSTAPLSMLSVWGVALFFVSVLLALSQLAYKLLKPEGIPQGIATTLLVVIFFGSVNLLGISILGEYLATIFEEVKRRPHSILRHVIRDGEVRAASASPGEDS